MTSDPTTGSGAGISTGAGPVSRALAGMSTMFRAICAICLGVIVLLACTEAVSRYALSNPSTWISTAILWINGWLVFLGAVVHFHRDTHLGFTEARNYLGPRARKIVVLAAELITVATLGYLAVLSWRLVKLSVGNIDLATGVPRWLFYLPMSVGLTLMTGVVLHRVLRGLSRKAELSR